MHAPPRALASAIPESFLAALLLAALPAAGQSITNPSFETDNFTVWPGYISGNGAITGWPADPADRVGLSLASGGPFADNGTIPNGANAAFIQNNPGGVSMMATVLNDLTPGTKYNVAFRINARGGNLPWLRFQTDGTGDPVNMEVTSVGGTNPYRYAACEFTATAASNVLYLLNTRGDGDHTVVIDDFSIAPSTGAWAYAPWTGDADSGIDPQYIYTHAYTFGDGNYAGNPPVTVNGVRFIPREGGIPTRFTLTGLMNTHPGAATGVSGESAKLATGFRYGGTPAITLDNLKPSTAYVFTFYGFGWDDPASGTPYRSSTFESSLGGDRFTVNLNHYGQGQGIRVTYAYTTDAAGSPVTISYPSNGSGTLHTCGFSNREATPGATTAWTTAAWSDDASSGVDGGYHYTHAYSFGSATATNINGVDFTGIAGANPAAANFASVLTGAYTNDTNNSITGTSAALARDFTYGGGPEVLHLMGLTPGKDYVLTIYSTGWDADGTRAIALFGKAADGPGVVDQNQFGADHGVRFEYRYTADAEELLVIASACDVDPNSTVRNMHVCGISNREAEPLAETAPAITLQPVGGVFGVGTDQLLRVGAVGSPTVTYQWQLDGEDLEGETGPVLALPAIGYDQAGAYSVTVTNDYGSLTSDVVTVVVYDHVPGALGTGVGADGQLLPDGAVDPHFTLVVNPQAPGSTEALVQTGIPGAWVPNSASSKWIGPLADTSGADGDTDAGEGPGVYVYRTHLDLSRFDPATVRISGSWASDNAGLAIRVNGVPTGLVNDVGNTFAVLVPFVIDATNAPGLVAGVNTIDFVVQNAGGGFTGLRVDGLAAVGKLLTNSPPEFAGFAAGTPFDTPADISTGKILTAASDPDGDPLAVIAAGPASANGGTVALQAGTVLYTPPAGFSGPDTFEVTISDNFNATVTGTITVTVASNTGVGTNQPVLTLLDGGGKVQVAFQGIPGRTYELQRSTDLTNWTVIATLAAGPDGALGIIDEDPPAGSAFYRIRKP